MKNVLLITQGFPYGVSEQGFLPTEYHRLQEAFRLSVMAFGAEGEPQFPLSERVRHRRYVWPSGASLTAVARQLMRPEVRADIALLCKSRKLRFLQRLGTILLYSARAEQVSAQLRQVIAEDEIDVVYTYWCVQATVAALRLKKEFPSLKVVSRFHGMDLYEEQLSLGWQPLRPYIARSCDRLVFICQSGMDYFMAHWGREWAQKSAVVHVGCRALPRRVCAAQGAALSLVSCSSVIPIKRVALIADALAALPDTVRVDWHHFGDGERMTVLQRHAADRLANRPQIHYTLHGAIPNEALPQAYLDAGAELFITLSETEGLPVSMMEAYAMGIPVIATAVGGIPEMVEDGESGFLLSANPEPTEAANALTRYLAMTEAEKQIMSQNAYERWKRDYDAAANADRLIALLNQTLKGEQSE